MSIFNSSSQIFANATSGLGTVGGFFTLPDGDIYGITNNHIIANANKCHKGDPVFIPSPDGNDPPMVGTLQHWVTLDPTQVNYLDIALFKVTDGLNISWLLPPLSGMPAKFDTPVPNDRIYMVLPNGTKRPGQITNPKIDFNTAFTLCGTNFSFTGLIEIQSMDNKPFAEHGNSGSIVFNSSGNIIGVILGTNFLQTRSYAIPFLNGKVGITGVYNLTITGAPVVAQTDEVV